MRPRAGFRSPAPDPKPRGAAWKWGITHAGDAITQMDGGALTLGSDAGQSATAARSARINDHRPAHADEHRSGSQTPAGAVEHRSGPQTPAGAAEPDHASAPDPAKLDAERPHARAYERVSMTATYLVVGFAS